MQHLFRTLTHPLFGTGLFLAIAQSQVSGENRQRVLAIELQASEGGAAASGILVLPLGLRLDEGVRLDLD